MKLIFVIETHLYKNCFFIIKKQFLYKWVSITNMSFMDGGSC
jgi:hypothetical protein